MGNLYRWKWSFELCPNACDLAVQVSLFNFRPQESAVWRSWKLMRKTCRVFPPPLPGFPSVKRATNCSTVCNIAAKRLEKQSCAFHHRFSNLSCNNKHLGLGVGNLWTSRSLSPCCPSCRTGIFAGLVFTVSPLFDSLAQAIQPCEISRNFDV